MDYNSHHSLHYDTHISIHHCTNYIAVTNQPWLSCHTCTSFTHPHISSTLPYKRCEVLFCPGWHSERFPCIYLDCLYYSDHLLPAFLTLPALWYPLCLPPAPTFALSLLLILPSLHCSCYCLLPLPVWPPLVCNKAAIGSNLTASSLQGDSHHRCATDKSAATAWCYHVNMDKKPWEMFPTPCWIYATNN